MIVRISRLDGVDMPKEWPQWMRIHLAQLFDRERNPSKYQVALTILETRRTLVRVSTVILTSAFFADVENLDRIEFETRVFVGGESAASALTTTRPEAVRVHRAAVDSAVWRLAAGRGQAVKSMEHWPLELKGPA